MGNQDQGVATSARSPRLQFEISWKNRLQNRLKTRFQNALSIRNVGINHSDEIKAKEFHPCEERSAERTALLILRFRKIGLRFSTGEGTYASS
jgi:hypothetical protein